MKREVDSGDSGFRPSMMNFRDTYEDLAKKLSKLLGMRFICGNKSSRSHIGQSLAGIVVYHNRREYIPRDVELARLRMLVKHLEEIEAFDPALLRSFKDKMHASGSRDQYFGTRFEINIAASLIRKQVKFTKGESPDFAVHGYSRDVYIECGSAHLSEPRLGDVIYKIGAVITKKSGKPYCHSACALFIDVTNIYYNTLQNEVLLDRDRVREYVQNELQSKGFGNVTLFTYHLNHDLRRFESAYIRVDSKNADANLSGFLDRFYPLGEHFVHAFSVPSET